MVQKIFYSQHANVLAVLTGVTNGREATTIMGTVLSDATLAPASIYFKYYLHLVHSIAFIDLLVRGNE